MKKLTRIKKLCLRAGFLTLSLSTSLAQTAFEAPDGGWDYLYAGDSGTYGDAGFTSLDGTWSHDNGSDQWDGSGPGDPFGPGSTGPGGAKVIDEDGVNYLRIQDSGDPRDYEMPDPSNRKVYLGHDLTAAGVSDTIMDDGVTLYFRARVPTSGPLDPLHRDGQAAGGTLPYPALGDGYVTSDGGKGNFVIKQNSGGAIAFSLTTADDTPGGDPTVNVTGFAGLTMNEFNGNAISGDVNFGQGQGQNTIALDPTEWHEFWIVIQRDEDGQGTHQALIFIDGDTSPKVFKMTAGTGDDYGGISYLAMGATATPQNAALDVDFFGYKLGAVSPKPKSFSPPAGGWDYLYAGDSGTYGDAGFTSLDGTWSHDNGSDQWDGSGPGDPFGPGSTGPGGAKVIDEDGVNYLRIQDSGDPRDYEMPDPSNRKVYLGHDLTAAGVSDTIMDDGVTLYFRARVPTSGPLDPLHRDGQAAGGTLPYPALGDGYVTSDGGKGNFVIKQNSGGAIAFSLTTADDTPGGDPTVNVTGFAGLTMNEFNGNAISGDVNFGQGQGQNTIALDPTEWHEFWIVIQRDEDGQGTHQALIFIDGDTSPKVFKMTAGTGDDYGGISYLAMGATATPQNAALDVDFYGIKYEAITPTGGEIIVPRLTEVSPENGATGVDPIAGLTFVASSAGAIPQSGIDVILNGRSYAADLQITGNEQRWVITLATLDPYQQYSGKLIITDSSGASLESIVFFDTFRTGNFTFEAEDYNFDGGMFIDNPVVSFDPGPDNYLDLVSVEGIDSHDLGLLEEGDHFYRIPDVVGTVVTGDAARPAWENFEGLDSDVNGIVAEEWLNYTRTVPAGEYGIIGRLAPSGAFTAQVDLVTGGSTSMSQTLEPIGVMSGSGSGYTYSFARDTGGNIATFNAGGVTTFRITSLTGTFQPNYYALIPAAELPSGNGGSGDPATLNISIANGMVTIAWDEAGTLQSATVLGDWSDESNQSNPWTGEIAGMKYFRVVSQ